MTEPEELIEKAARVLAETFTTPEGERNPAWDIDKPDGPDNLYYLPRPMAERVEMGAWIVFNDTDGQRSMRPATLVEIAQVLADRQLLADPEQGSELERLHKLARRAPHAAQVEAEERALTSARLADDTSLMLRAMARRTRRFRLLMNVNYREVCDAKDVIDGLQTRVTELEQVLAIVRAQNDDCVEQVDAALGHRYHTRGVHYSIPHVAEQAAAEIQQLQARVDKALALHDPERGMEADPDGRCFECGEVMPCPTRAALQPAPVLPGDETPQPEEDQ